MFFLTYVVRSLRTRLRANVVTVLSVALFITGGYMGLLVYLNLKKDLVDQTPAENILIMGAGSFAEPESRIELDVVRQIAVLDGIKKGSNGPLVVAELVSNVNLPTESYFPEGRVIRGIDERSLEVHGARVLEGRPPAPNTNEVMIGRKIARSFPKLKVGSEIYLPGGASKISGIFTTGTGPLDDEVWTSRKALEVHIKSQYLSTMTIVADSPARVPDLVAKINGTKDLNVTAASRASLLAAEAGLATTLRVVMVLLILLAVVATSAIAATMSAAILARIPELAALIAIGARRAQIIQMVVLESVILTVAGTLLGLAVAETVRRAVGTVPIGYPVELTPNFLVAAIALALGPLVGLLGAIAPSIRVRRLDVISAIR